MTTNLPTVPQAPDPRVPILTPLLNLLKQRKVVLGLIVLAVYLLTLAVPAAAKYQDLLMTAFLTIASATLIPMTLEDIVKAVKMPFNPAGAATDVTNALRDELLKGLLDRLPPPPPDEVPSVGGQG